MNIHPLFLALILASLHAVAHAQLFKCKGANDRYTFQDVPCAPDTNAPERQRPKAGEKNESFTQPKKDNRPGANWGPRTPMPQSDRINSPQASMPTQLDAARSPAASPSGKSWQEKEQDYQKRRAEDQTKAYNDQVKSNNQMHECNYARQQLGVLKEGRRVFSRDNKGERQYLDEENRQAEKSRVEQQIAKACK